MICEILGCSKADLCQPFMNLRVELDKKSPRQMFAGDLFASLPDVDQEDIIAMMIERKHRLAGQTE